MMLLGAVLVTASNSVVASLVVCKPVLLQGRYLVQWFLGIGGLLVRSKVLDMEFHPFGPRGVRHLLVIRGFVYYAFIWLWVLTLHMVPVGDAVAVVKFEVFVTGLASYFVCGEKLTTRWFLCCCVSIVGVMLIARPPMIFGGTDDSTALGRLLNVLTPLVGGILPVFIKLAKGAYFLEVTSACDFVCAVVMSPLVVYFTGTWRLLLDVSMIGSFCTVAFLGLSALSCITLAYQRGNAGSVALVGYLEVPMAYAMQVIAFGKKIEPLAALGAFVVVAASMTTTWDKRRALEQEELVPPPSPQ